MMQASRRRAVNLAFGICMSLLAASAPAHSQTLPNYYPEDYKQLIETRRKRMRC